jgi:hypothetical protein
MSDSAAALTVLRLAESKLSAEIATGKSMKTSLQAVISLKEQSNQLLPSKAKIYYLRTFR